MNADDCNKSVEAGLGAAPCSASVRVAAIAPFWRYAVGPTAAHSPAIPYYRLASAVAFFEEAKRDMPWAGAVLYKRRGLRGIEAVREYTPNGALCEGAKGNDDKQ